MSLLLRIELNCNRGMLTEVKNLVVLMALNFIYMYE